MKRHVELWAFNSKGQHVATGLVTPAGVCGFATSRCIHVDYSKRGFGFGVTNSSVNLWKYWVKTKHNAVRFQRVVVGS